MRERHFAKEKTEKERKKDRKKEREINVKEIKQVSDFLVYIFAERETSQTKREFRMQTTLV